MSIRKVTLPLRKQPTNLVLDQLKAEKQKDVEWKNGKVFDLVYYAGEEVLTLIKKTQEMFTLESGTNLNVLPSIKKLEKEVVSMVSNLLHGDKHTAGTMTSSHSESLLLALTSAKQWARLHKPMVKSPNIILPSTAHPNFDRAANLLEIELIKVKPKDDFTANVQTMDKLINQNTIMIIASAPQVPHGIIDPIEELSAIATKKNILFHVDAAVGAMLLPFVKKLGYDIPNYDFKCEGVSSISIDLDQYGYAPPGSSLVLYKNRELRRLQFYVNTNWSGGVFASATFSNVRNASSIASSWAILHHLGIEGYIEINDKVMKTANWVKKEIETMDTIKILGNPITCIMAIGANKNTNNPIDIYQLGNEMCNKGWQIQKQQNPPSLHLAINFVHIKKKELFISDLKASIIKVQRVSLAKFSTSVTKNLTKVLPLNWIKGISKVQYRVKKSNVKKSANLYHQINHLKQEDIQTLLLDILDRQNQ